MQEKLDLFQSILTVDNGYGDIKWVWKNRKGDVKKGKFTSIVAEAPMSANDYIYIDLLDLRNDIEEISQNLTKFIKMNEISVLVIENYNFQFELPSCENIVI